MSDLRRKESLYYPGVELRAAAADDFAEGDFMRQSAAVGSVRGHGVVDIGDGDDPRSQRDRLAGEAFRVAGAVPVLVVVTDDVCTLAVHAELAREIRPGRRMHVDLLALVVCQGPLLEEDAVVDRDLAKIVDVCRRDNQVDLLSRQVQARRDLPA